MDENEYLNYKIQRCLKLKEDMTQYKSLSIGDVPKGGGTPDEYYVIEKKGEVYWVLKAYHRGWGFAENTIWNNYVAIGFSDFFYLIDLENNKIVSIDFNGEYFGHLYTSNDYIWISSMCDLLCINMQGQIVWRLDDIAVDGICIHDLEGKYLEIDCELDPPGGWVSYIVDNTKGVIVNSL